MGGLQNHYAILKVAPDADAEVIRAAYKALMLKHHPDKNAQTPAALARTQQINEAFSVLSDPERRADYDLAASFETSDLRSSSFGDRSSFTAAGSTPFEAGKLRKTRCTAALALFSVSCLTLIAAAGAFRAISAAPGAPSALSASHAADPSFPPSDEAAPLASLQSRLSAVTGGGSEAAPKIIHVQNASPAKSSGPAAAAGLTFLRAWTDLTAPRFSRRMIGSAAIYQRSDPLGWIRAQFRKMAQAWRRAPTAKG